MHVGIVKLTTMLLTQPEITKIMTSFRRKCSYLMTGNLVIFGLEEVANSASLTLIILVAPSLFSTLERRVPLRRAMPRQDLSNSVIPGRRGPVDRSNTCVS